MTQNPARFANLLRTAIRMIRAREDKPLGVIRDQLGWLINHSGGDYILYLEKGHVPPNSDEVQKLAQELLRRGGLGEVEYEQMLRAAAWRGEKDLPEGQVSGVSGQASKVFIAGPAIRDPARFFGRTRELQRIFGYWRHPPLEHIAIIGPRRAGKTSLLWHLAAITTTTPAQRRAGQKHDWLPRPERVRWIFVDLQAAQMQEPELVLRYLIEQFGLPSSTPHTLPAVMEAVSAGDARPTILLLDELGAGFERLGRDFWWGLRAAVVNGRNSNVALVVAGQENPAALKSRSDSTSPFANIFADYIPLGPFTEAEARELIASAPAPAFSEEEIAWILAQSGRWPQLVQILCQERMRALEEGDGSAHVWRQEGLRRIEPFRYLLEIKA